MVCALGDTCFRGPSSGSDRELVALNSSRVREDRVNERSLGMLKRVAAVAIMVVCCTLVIAEEYTASISKVDGGKVTFQKLKRVDKKFEKDGDPMTLPVADNVKVNKGKFNKDTMKFDAGDEIKDGLKNEMFTKIGDKGVRATIITDADNKKITEIRTVQFGGPKKDKGTDK
jgi:hypothetical protein